MKIGAIIQARMGSTRLPGKVMRAIGDAPMLKRVIERVSRVPELHEILVATSDLPDDDIISTRCAVWDIGCYRGSHLDVLDRYYRAAVRMELSVVVRITADCPLLDPDIVSKIIQHFIYTNSDYASNVHPATFPDGLDCEVIKMDALEIAWDEATNEYDREHVTSYIWKSPERFHLENVTRVPDLSHLRWTVDTQEDLDRVRHLFALYPPGSMNHNAILQR